MSNEGKRVRAHYRGTLDDGTQFDSSYDRGEPLEFTCCAHQMIPGFDAAVKDMEVGEKKTVHIPCAARTWSCFSLQRRCPTSIRFTWAISLHFPALAVSPFP